MTVTVTPDHLDDAAAAIAAMADGMTKGPLLHAAEAAAQLATTGVGKALAQTNVKAHRAKQVLAGRYAEVAGLLRYSAAEYRKADQRHADLLQQAVSDRLAALGDLNNVAVQKDS